MSLLIHDHPDVIELLTVNLRGRGHRFHVARDLRAGLAHLQVCTHERVLVHDGIEDSTWLQLLPLLPHGARLSLWTGTWFPLPRPIREYQAVQVDLLLGAPSLRQLLDVLLPVPTAVAA